MDKQTATMQELAEQDILVNVRGVDSSSIDLKMDDLENSDELTYTQQDVDMEAGNEQAWIRHAISFFLGAKTGTKMCKPAINLPLIREQ